MGIVNHTLHKMLKTHGGLISPEDPKFITNDHGFQDGFLILFHMHFKVKVIFITFIGHES